jgi:hypothetical protein
VRPEPLALFLEGARLFDVPSVGTVLYDGTAHFSICGAHKYTPPGSAGGGVTWQNKTKQALHSQPPQQSSRGDTHALYLYSAMSDMSLRTSSWGRRASAPTSQES